MGWIGNKDKYAQDSEIVRGDYLIGTPSNGIGTKTFTVESLQGFTEDTVTYQQAQAFITGSSLRAGCYYQITDAGVSDDLIVVQAMSSNTFHQICRKLSDIENLYSYNISTNTLSLYTSGGGGGESNTASSSGLGVQLTLPKNGVDLPFRTIESATLELAQNADTISIEGATVAQGDLASTSIQPLDNISELTNDVNFVTQFNLDTKADKDGAVITNASVNGVELTTAQTENLFLNATGVYSAPAGSDGEANTTSTLGSGVALTSAKVGVDLPFKGLKSLGATLTSDATSVTINGASTQQGAKADTAIQPSDNISELTNDSGFITADTNTLTNTSVNGVTLTTAQTATRFLNGQGDYVIPESSGVGESNTTSNEGIGEGLALPKVGVDLPFKTLLASGGATISSNATTVTFSVSSAQYATAAQGILADTAIQSADLATVATTGSYTDLINQPTIPPAAPVDSVNGNVGVVVLDAEDVSAAERHVLIRTIAGLTDTLVLADDGKYLRYTNAAAVTATVPPNASVAFPTGTVITMRQAGAGQVTLAAGAGVTLNGEVNTAEQHASIQIMKVDTDVWDVIGGVA